MDDPNWETLMHFSLFTTFSLLQFLVFPPSIFDKSTPVTGETGLQNIWKETKMYSESMKENEDTNDFNQKCIEWDVCMADPDDQTTQLPTASKRCLGCEQCLRDEEKQGKTEETWIQLLSS